MDDYIIREAAVRYLKGFSESELSKNGNFGRITSSVLNKAERAISEMPTADVQPVKHGHWVKGHCGVDEYIKCSVCRTRIVNTIVSLEGDAAEDYFDLCPKCGARMDGDKNEP
jgi:hypothetical protein